MCIFQINLPECYIKRIVTFRLIVVRDLQATVFSVPQMARSFFCNYCMSACVSSGSGSIVIFKSRNVSPASARTSQKTQTPSIIKTKHGIIPQKLRTSTYKAYVYCPFFNRIELCQQILKISNMVIHKIILMGFALFRNDRRADGLT